jgi:putative transcriptional regulator
MPKSTKRSGIVSKARTKAAGGRGDKVRLPKARKAKRGTAKRYHATGEKRAPRYMGDLFEAVHSSASDLLAVGAISKQTMREYDELCIEPPKELSARNIKALREGLNMSQPIFARRIYVSPSTVAKWEAGTNKPSGIALKYLNVLKRLGAEALD